MRHWQTLSAAFVMAIVCFPDKYVISFFVGKILFTIFVAHRFAWGAQAFAWAEIIPVTPDSDNADVGTLLIDAASHAF